MALYKGDKITTAKELRQEKQEWKESTFSVQDLKKAGMKPDEIKKLFGETRHEETRYNKEYIRTYFKNNK